MDRAKIKCLLKKSDRENHPVNGSTLQFKWSISRARDSYGYNICSPWFGRNSWSMYKAASCNVGGYDMTGMVLSDWMEQTFPEELKRLNTCDFYGLRFWNVKRHKSQKRYSPNCKILLDGSCGQSSMEIILRKIGFKLVYVGSPGRDRDNSAYMIEAV